MNPTLAAHAAAILTILIWGATFTSTKVLLQAFAPIEILFLRFLLGACALLLACPACCMCVTGAGKCPLPWRACAA